MKKKFVLTLALVLMVAVALPAATPVEVSGTFDFGYKISKNLLYTQIKIQIFFTNTRVSKLCFILS